MSVAYDRIVRIARLGTDAENDKWLMAFNGDPTTDDGAPGAEGSWGFNEEALYAKTGPDPTDWTIVGSIGAGVPAASVTPGTFGSSYGGGDYEFSDDLTVVGALSAGLGYFGTDTALSSPAVRIVADNAAPANLDNFRFGNTPRFNAYRVNGSIASPTTIVNGNEIAALQFGGYDGTTYTNVGASITATALVDWTSGTHYARLDFQTVPTASTTVTVGMRLWATKGLRVGASTTVPSQVGYYGSSDNVEDIYESGTRARAVYAYTLNAATKVLSPLLHSGTELSGDVGDIVVESSTGAINAYRTANPAFFGAWRVNNTMASPTAVVNGNQLGIYSFGGYSGASFQRAGVQLTAFAKENWSGSVAGARLEAFQVPIGSNTLTRTFYLNNTTQTEFILEGISLAAESVVDVTGTGGTHLPGFVGRFTRTGPAAVQSNDTLVRLAARGYDGTAFSGTRAQVQMLAAGTWTTSSHPAKIIFATTSASSIVQVNRWTINEDGHLIPAADNTYDAASSGVRIRVGYFYTGNFTTAVIAGASDPGGSAPIRANGVINSVNGAFKNTGTYTVTSGEGLSAITTSATITAATGSVRGLFVNSTMVAAANADNLEAARISVLATPGAFTGLVARGLVLSSFSVAGFTSPGDTKMIQTGTLTGTGATNARGIEIGTVTGATNNYALTTNGGTLLVSGSFTMNSGQGALYLDATITATGGIARATYSNATLVAAANADALTSTRINSTHTPGSFTGVVARGLQLGAFSVAGFTTPGDPIMFDVGILTGTGATNAYAIKFGAGPSGATNNYLLHATNFFVTSGGTLNANSSVNVGSGVTTANQDAIMTVNAGTNAGANDKDSYYGVQRGGTSLWRMGVLGSVAADANWTLRDVVNSKSAVIVTPNTLIATFGGAIGFKVYTVATLPAAPAAGWSAAVSDSLAAPVYNAAVVAGGAVYAKVTYTGAAWVYA